MSRLRQQKHKSHPKHKVLSTLDKLSQTQSHSMDTSERAKAAIKVCLPPSLSRSCCPIYSRMGLFFFLSLFLPPPTSPRLSLLYTGRPDFSWGERKPGVGGNYQKENRLLLAFGILSASCALTSLSLSNLLFCREEKEKGQRERQ